MGVSLPSKSPLFLRLFLAFLLPAALSTNTLQSWDNKESLSWLKYWIVLSFALMLEFLLDQVPSLQGKSWLASAYNLLKISFILWCVAPITYNGSELTYTNTVAPLFELSKHSPEYMKLAANSVGTVAAVTAQNVVEVSAVAAEYTGIVAAATAEYVAEMAAATCDNLMAASAVTAEYIVAVSTATAEYVMEVSAAVADYVSTTTPIVVEKMTECAVELWRLVALAAALTMEAVLTVADYVATTTPIVLAGISHYGGEFLGLLKDGLEVSKDGSIRVCEAIYVGVGDMLGSDFLQTAITLVMEVIFKVGEFTKAAAINTQRMTLDVLAKSCSTGEDYRLLAGVLNSLVEKETGGPRRLFSTWLKTVLV